MDAAKKHASTHAMNLFERISASRIFGDSEARTWGDGRAVKGRPGVRKSGYEEPTREEPAAIRAIIDRTGRQVKKVFPMGRNTNSYEGDDSGATEGVLVPSQRNSKYAPGRTFRTSFGRKHAMHSPPGCRTLRNTTPFDPPRSREWANVWEAS